MANWHYLTYPALIILLGISSSSCESGASGIPPDDESPVVSLSASTVYHKTPISSLMHTPRPTIATDDSHQGLDSKLATGIIVGLLLIVLILLVCIIAVGWYIIRTVTRKNHAQFMEVSITVHNYS